MTSSRDNLHAALSGRDDLLRLLEVSRRLAGAGDLGQLLALIVEQACSLLAAERASVFLYDAGTRELFSRVATGVESIRFSIDAGIAGAAARDRGIINVPDAYADARFNREVDRRTGFVTRNILSIPLIDYDDELAGVLQVLNKRDGTFGDYDQALAEMLASQAAVAVQRARLIEQVIEKERLEREMSIAREIQQALLPKNDPDVAGFEIAGWSRPADSTGGDAYDFFPLADGSLAITVADATGHGIGPALVVAEARALFRAAASTISDICETVNLVNRILSDDLPADRFVTAFFGLLRADGCQLAWASGGHGPMLLYRSADDSIVEFKATGVPLGIAPDLPVGPGEPITLGPGDQFLVLTDGFAEYANTAGEMFGVERVNDWLRQTRGLPAHDAILDLCRRVEGFAPNVAQADDLTAVLIRKK